MFIHDLLENVPNAVPGRRHADKFIDHQSISPNIHYVKFWYDCVWFCIKFWWQLIQLQSTCMNQARIQFYLHDLKGIKKLIENWMTTPMFAVLIRITLDVLANYRKN